MRYVLAGLALLLVLALPARADDLLVVKESAHSVPETLDRLARLLESKGITIFARIDHAAGAKATGAEMKPAELLIFGNPKLGTPLIQADRRIGIDLPLKALAWEDDAGKVWLAYTSPSALKARFAIAGRDEVFKTMAGALETFTASAIKAD